VTISTLESNRRRMVAILSEITTGEGMRPSCLEGVQLSRADRMHPRMPVLYEPSIYIVANGRKTGYLGERRFTYDPNNYLVLSVPLPFECETEAASDGPMLGISVRVTPSLVSDLAVRMPSRPRPPAMESTGYVEATPLDLAMSDAALRLVECLRSPVEADILGPGIVREIVYRALCGPQGHLLLEMVGRQGQAAQINAALRWMHAHYAEPFSVARMAAEVGMSVSAFHHQFKALTASSPVQYLKSVRLHKARKLIVDEGAGAAEAAVAVGYESASQFSREFKRFFGTSPSEAARQVRSLAARPMSVREAEARAS
jgi:AraC-like DNA-binding protein